MRSAYMSLLVVAGADCALSHIQGPSHIHRSHGYELPADMLEPRDLNQFDALHIPADPAIEFRTLTTTIYGNCAEPTTKSALFRKVIEEKHKPESTNDQLEYAQVVAHQPQVVVIKQTSTILTTVTEIDIVTESAFVPEKTPGPLTSHPSLEDNTASTSTKVAADSIIRGIDLPMPSTNRTDSPSPLPSVSNRTVSSSTTQPIRSIKHIHGTAQHVTTTTNHVSASVTHLSHKKTSSVTNNSATKPSSETTIGSLKKRPIPNKTSTVSTLDIKTNGSSKTGTKEQSHPAKHGTEQPVPITTTHRPASSNKVNGPQAHPTTIGHSLEMGTHSSIPPVHHAEDQHAPKTAHTKPDPGLLGLPALSDMIPETAVLGLPSEIGQALDPNESPLPDDLKWTSFPKDGLFSTDGFGGRTSSKGANIKYKGNVGVPWGSNIITVSPTQAHQYKYLVQFSGPRSEPWTVLFWNKIGPDDKIDGWYGHSALQFILAPGETQFVAFDEDSVGGWSAAPGNAIPVDQFGGYTSTWGEFAFGDKENRGWSGWDVSVIQGQLAHQDVPGMRICQADGVGCSTITSQAKKVINAYTESQRHKDGIGGASSPGPVRLVAELDYQE